MAGTCQRNFLLQYLSCRFPTEALAALSSLTLLDLTMNDLTGTLEGDVVPGEAGRQAGKEGGREGWREGGGAMVVPYTIWAVLCLKADCSQSYILALDVAKAPRGHACDRAQHPAFWGV